MNARSDTIKAEDAFLGARCDVGSHVNTHLFVISPNNSGSTFVTRAIEACGDVWRLPREGQHMLGYEGPDLIADRKELIWAADAEYLEGMRARERYDWEKTRKAWYFQARASRPEASVFLTKAPPFLLVVDQLRETFENARFLFLVRNPYAVIEAICRYHGTRFASRKTALKTATTHTIRCLQQQYENVSRHGDVGTFFSYESLCARPADMAKQVSQLIPELDDLDFDRKIAVKTHYHERLRDMNADQIKRLSPEDLRTINDQLKEQEILLQSFDYGILNP